jgi:hypothetical protein
MLKRLVVTIFMLAGLALTLPICAQRAPAQEYVNAQLPWDTPVVDGQGKLLAWFHPNENLGYDHVLRLAWNLLEHLPNDRRTGMPAYLNYAVFNPQTLEGSLHGSAQNNPASMFGQFVDSVVGWYPYSEDQTAVALVRRMLDYQLAHGTTPADWEWAQVPFADGCNGAKIYGGCMTDMPEDYVGGIEVDKVGELGIGYVLFYEMTGDRKYLEAGIRRQQVRRDRTIRWHDRGARATARGINSHSARRRSGLSKNVEAGMELDSELSHEFK